MNIGNRIHELRERRGITQEQLSAALGVSPQAVSKWETSVGCPDISLLPVIAGYFGVSIDTLFEYDADRLAAVIEDIHRNYTECFWNEPERAEKILLDGIARYPSADRLKADLVELYVRSIPQDYYGEEWFSANRDTALKAFRDACVFFGIEEYSRRQ